MSGSSVYGKGYHDGKHDAREEDLIVGAVVAGVGLAITGGIVVAKKIKKVYFKRETQRLLEDGPDELGGDENGSDEPRASQ